MVKQKTGNKITNSVKSVVNELKIAVNEKDVENAWRGYLKLVDVGATITSPHNTDGVMDRNDIKILLELKYDEKFDNKRVKCNALAQALLYLERFKKDGKVPDIIFIGDKKSCFFLPTEYLDMYLNESNQWHKQINWSSPSDAAKNNPLLIDSMEKNSDLDVLNLKIQGDAFWLKDLLPMIEFLGKHPKSKIPITGNNILAAISFFETNVIIDKRFKQKMLINSEENYIKRIVDLFYNCLTDHNSTVSTGKGYILSHGDRIIVNEDQRKAFFKLFNRHCNPKELDILVSKKDELIEELTRRKTGAFFTPELWIEKAHIMISKQWVDWVDKFTIWDPAGGTNNLTRNLKCGELYTSTLEQGDVDTVKDMGYKGDTFQFDFLNDKDERLPKKLRDVLKPMGKTITSSSENIEALKSYGIESHTVKKKYKPLLFFMNPPYGTAKTGTLKKGESKKGIADTYINKIMKDDNMGACSQQLYAQFLYRILKYKKVLNLDIKICVFSNPAFMSSESFDKFRDAFYEEFEFKDGILFPANQFADVSDGWGISFTIWDSKKERL